MIDSERNGKHVEFRNMRKALHDRLYLKRAVKLINISINSSVHLWLSSKIQDKRLIWNKNFMIFCATCGIISRSESSENQNSKSYCGFTTFCMLWCEIL